MQVRLNDLGQVIPSDGFEGIPSFAWYVGHPYMIIFFFLIPVPISVLQSVTKSLDVSLNEARQVKETRK